MRDLVDQAGLVALQEGRLEGEKLVERRAQRIDVTQPSCGPRNRSGGMYRNVPIMSCDCESSSPSTSFARPKSVTQTIPRVSRSRFDGLMSR